jgi:hypothetical protein
LFLNCSLPPGVLLRRRAEIDSQKDKSGNEKNRDSGSVIGYIHRDNLMAKFSVRE